jgi:hypothetical protein
MKKINKINHWTNENSSRSLLGVIRKPTKSKTGHRHIMIKVLNSQSAGKPATQESSLDVFCHVIFDVNIDVMDVRGRPQEFVAL